MKSAGTLKYVAGAGDNNVVCAGGAILHGIIVGKDVASSVIEVSDHASDGDGNIVMQFDGSTLMTANGGYIQVEAHFIKGICADLVNQTQVTFVYSPF